MGLREFLMADVPRSGRGWNARGATGRSVGPKGRQTFHNIRGKLAGRMQG